MMFNTLDFRTLGLLEISYPSSHQLFKFGLHFQIHQLLFSSLMHLKRRTRLRKRYKWLLGCKYRCFEYSCYLCRLIRKYKVQIQRNGNEEDEENYFLVLITIAAILLITLQIFFCVFDFYSQILGIQSRQIKTEFLLISNGVYRRHFAPEHKSDYLDHLSSVLVARTTSLTDQILRLNTSHLSLVFV